MEKCFVIQPFDKGTFDKRFADHYVPAITAAGLEPYRVDRDPRVKIPIESIHGEIEKSAACLADISTDNPNVWYELGFALASRKEVVIVSSKDERKTAYPFDIRHLAIVEYSSGSGSDFKKLEENITSTLKARLEERSKLTTIAKMSPVHDVEGLSSHETAALVILMSSPLTPESFTQPWEFRSEMTKAGYNNVAANLSIKSLHMKALVTIERYEDEYGQTQLAYLITEKGISWLLKNQKQLVLRNDGDVVSYPDDFDDSDPFADE